jgi:hypothetical protein
MAPSFDQNQKSKNESSSGESAPLLQQTSTTGTPIQQQQQQQQQQPYGTAAIPSPYDPNNTMMTGGYFAPPPGHYPPPGTSSGFSQHLQQQQQLQHSPIIIHSPNQPSSQVIGAIPPGTSGMPPQPPFFYPFPPQQQNGAGPGAPYPYPPAPQQPMYPIQQPQQQQYQQRQQQQQQYQYQFSSSPKTSSRMMGMQVGSNNNNSARRTVGAASHSSSGLPPLNDIFDESGGSESQPILGSNNSTATTTSALPPLAGTSSGYGSTGSSPKVYNAPVQTRRLPPSGRSPQQFVPLKGGETTNGQKSAPNKNHRRVHSDAPLRTNRAHRRNGSGDGALLPPLRPGAIGGHNRSRTLSGGNPLLAKSRHRRGNSSNSYHSMAGDSYGAGSRDSSMMSMRSNIAKSSLFGGIDEQGRPIMYYPYEAIRLVMIPNKEKSGSTKTSLRNSTSTEFDDDDTAEKEEHLPLTIGHLYSDGPANIEDYYEDYHRISDDLEQGITPQWESLDVHPILRKTAGGKGGEGGKHAACGCECTNCHACLGKQDLLPPTNYVVAISDDIYRRMFSEVADAQNMPCGLFFCGHHEDVDYPSVWIPGTLVIILFGGIIFMSYCTGFVN